MSTGRPEGLGRWEPPPDSVVLRSGPRVDLVKASRGYAVAVLFGAALITAWLVSANHDGTVVLDDVTRDLLRSRLGYRAAPFVVVTALLAFMGLGTTKRCFGFDRGTLYGLLWIGLAQVGAIWPIGPFGEQVAVGAGMGMLGALLAVTLPFRRGRPPEMTRRRALASVAYFGFVAAAWQLARVRYQRWPWLDEGQSAQLAMACGLTLGAAVIAAPWLWARARSDP